MKKMSGFCVAQRKKVKDLTKEIEMRDVESQRKKLKNLLEQRKSKWKEISEAQQHILPRFKHIKKQYSEFSLLNLNSSDEPFIRERDKMKISSTDRVYSSLPNSIIDSKIVKYHKLMKETKSQIDDPLWKNRKFLEFEKIIEEQTAKHTISLQKLKKKSMIPKESVGFKMGKTYFQKFTTHKYNFYDSNNFVSKSSLLARSKTERLMHPTLLSEKSKLGESTLDSIRQSKDYSLDGSIANKSRLKRSKLEEFVTYRIRVEKNRDKSPVSKKLTLIKLQKNINSIEY